MATRIVITGLPASGKSSLAQRLGRTLAWPVLDKDAFLEALFAETPPSTTAERNALSRHADLQFREAADGVGDAILVSWWRHPKSAEASGTSVEWLSDGGRAVLEVHCECPAPSALERFLDRTRHPGHLDSKRDRKRLAEQFVMAEQRGPLGLFPVIRVDTTRRIDVDALLGEIRERCNLDR
jgi:glucokinase